MDLRTETRTGAIMETIRAELSARTLTPGEKLLSIQRFTATMKISPSTIVAAYDRLVPTPTMAQARFHA